MTLTAILTGILIAVICVCIPAGAAFLLICKGGWALPDHPVETPAETITTTTD